MKTQKQMKLEFKMHKISSAIENLRWALIYETLDCENSQHYFDKLNDAIQEYHNTYLKNDLVQLEKGE